MSVESNYVRAIVTLSDWLKNPPPVSKRIRSKSKTNCSIYVRYLQRLEMLHLIATNSDWFIALFAPVVIGRSNYFGTGFSTVV